MKKSNQLAPSTNASAEEKPSTASSNELVKAIDKTGDVVVEVVKEMGEETPTKQWMKVAASLMGSGGKPVAIILSLGFISIPLMVSDGPLVPIILATGASIVAVLSAV